MTSRFEWTTLLVSGFPYRWLFIDGQKTTIGFNIESIDELRFNHVVMPKLAVGTPTKDVDAELQSVLRTELHKLRLTEAEVQEALDQLVL